jgi:hypothetical protein
MFADRDHAADQGEGVSEQGELAGEGGARIPVEGADGWSYLPFERDEQTREHRITLVRDDGETVRMTLPSFVERGDELAEIARLVIRARERWRELKGLGA